MKLSMLLTALSLVISGCVHNNRTVQSDCVNYDVFGPRDHSCPELKHGPCPFCGPEQQRNIKLANL